MKIWALADLHLSGSNPEKDMSYFGPAWERYTERIEANWKTRIAAEDLVLLPGDISWAKTGEEAKVDLSRIDALPGTKVLVRGNHDYWWASNAKMERMLPSSIRFVHNNALSLFGVAIGGSRLWDSSEYDFEPFIERKENPKERKEGKPSEEEKEKIFEKELERLERSLQSMDPSASFRIALTHYPPVGADLAPSRASALLEKYGIDVCVFGHLHSVKEGALPFGEARGVRYVFASADYVRFEPVNIL